MLGKASRQLTGARVVDPQHTVLLIVFVHEPAIEGVDLIWHDLAIVPKGVTSEDDHSILDVDQARSLSCEVVIREGGVDNIDDSNDLGQVTDHVVDWEEAAVESLVQGTTLEVGKLVPELEGLHMRVSVKEAIRYGQVIDRGPRCLRGVYEVVDNGRLLIAEIVCREILGDHLWLHEGLHENLAVWRNVIQVFEIVESHIPDAGA